LFLFSILEIELRNLHILSKCFHISSPISGLFFFFFFWLSWSLYSGLRTSCLLGKCSTIWATLPVLFLLFYFIHLFIYFIHMCIQCLGHFSPLSPPPL
jgi:hypothetical protein